ncbi:helix-turn-helix domain-containing protein [Planotetraspora kaengkrachanensis]|uniref:Transcriptional regulator n=1 Tax=Planotetraspora kaengkrachanensis TaxID=575193 RepID=A0A8J3PZA1_9ACTN|nr:helix-turn-helix transcriptional regulator [Planotetraspora kaengkrachanensis]GIG83881.1 transcriptional regulator [Planotetraspora kaengkrachanensis]
MAGGGPLGDFLRARRQVTAADRVGPDDVAPRRRKPGLRHDEVARLAGVSTDYYMRLEQGSERDPSDQVLGALARVLQLDLAATRHLYELAHRRAGPMGRVIGSRGEPVGPQVLRFIERQDDVAALVVNRHWDVLAQNALGAALYEGLEYRDNLIRMTFLNPESRRFYRDWEQEASFKVAHLRAAVGTNRGDPTLYEMVEQLSLGSDDFRRLWARHDVQDRTHGTIRIHRDDVGDLVLTFEIFAVCSASGQLLIVLQSEPGSPSERALARLGGLAATT